ncbi:FUSC family protein [Acidobacteria bacterium AB60]|nr:FUSC family protein [Acidobacteria bacterium AB60]
MRAVTVARVAIRDAKKDDSVSKGKRKMSPKLAMPAASTRFIQWRRSAMRGVARVLHRDPKRVLIHALRTTIAASLCWWLAARLGLHDGYWGAISAIIVLQSNVGATIQASRDRILGTIIGAGVGFSCTLFGGIPWNYIIAVFLALMLCGLLGFRNSSRLAGVTVTIVMLVQSNSPRTVALDRVIQVVLGIMVAVVVTLVVFPRHGWHASHPEAGPPAPQANDRQGNHSE